MTIFNSILHVVSEKKIFEISAKTNFFSRTTGWIGTIVGRNVPCKVLIKCCYFCSDSPLFKMAAVTKNRNFFNQRLLWPLQPYWITDPNKE
jgi:hypothetical protein